MINLLKFLEEKLREIHCPISRKTMGVIAPFVILYSNKDEFWEIILLYMQCQGAFLKNTAHTR